MPGQHALLSASSSKRWLHCPPSVRLEENFPEETSSFAEEGTWAHELCEYKVKKYLHRRMKRPQSDYLTEEIENLTDIYAEFVISTIEKMQVEHGAVLALVEEKLDYSHIAPSGSDRFGQFIEAWLEVGETYEVRTSAAYKRYSDWCREYNYHAESVKNFKAAMEKRFVIDRKRPNDGGDKTTMLLGCRFREEELGKESEPTEALKGEFDEL